MAKDNGNAAMMAELEKLRAENESLKANTRAGISFKVSEKGGVSVYGLGRFPVTLYGEQWTKLLACADNIKAFLEQHRAELKVKEVGAKPAAAPVANTVAA